MKKFLVLIMAVMLNCSSAWAKNNLLDYDWWRHATVDDVKKEIDNGANVNAKDNIGRTALMWASYFDNVEIVKALIDAGADVNAKDNNGETAWYRATLRGNIKVKKVLEEAGAKKQKLKTLGKNIKEQAENIVLVPLEIVGVVAFFGILGFQYVSCTGDGLFNPGCMWK